jgi:hypothetical protein
MVIINSTVSVKRSPFFSHALHIFIDIRVFKVKVKIIIIIINK